MPLLSLPNELLLIIAEYLENRHLNAFHRANHRLANLLTPVLLECAVKDINIGSLHRAARVGNVELVRLLLSKGAQVHEKYSGFGTIVTSTAYINTAYKTIGTALHWAVYAESEAAIRLILENGGSLDSQCTYQNSRPVSWAAQRGSEKMVKFLLDIDPDPNNTINELDDLYRLSILHWAARYGKESVVRLLLERGANADIRGNARYPTALDWACHTNPAFSNKGRKAVCDLLLRRCIEIDAPESKAPFIVCAAMNGLDDIVCMLLEKGASVDTKCLGGRSALAWAIGQEQWPTVELLLGKGADIMAKGPGGLDALDVSILSFIETHDPHLRKIGELLVRKCIDIEAENSINILRCAAVYGLDDIVLMFLEKGIGLDEGGGGDTVLGWAVRSWHDSTIKLLLEKIEDLTIKNKDDKDPKGESALDWADSGSDGVCELLRRYMEAGVEGKYPFLHCAAKNGLDDVILMLLEKGADINSVCKTGQTALVWAVSHGRVSTVKLLLEKGADVTEGDYILTGLEAYSPPYPRYPECIVHNFLEKSVQKQSNWEERVSESVNILMRHYIETGIPEPENSAPFLHRAAEYGFEDVVRMLLEKGVGPNLWYRGDLPIYWARYKKRHSIVELLLKHGSY